ncbi:MAG: response regulator [Anaerolineales bacterium]|nr:response regulator [Anaerolineales bacterium]
MSETNHEEYKKQVEEMGKHLLDVISSVSNGDYNVNVNIPEGSDVLADLAIGLEFLIEDLRESASKSSTFSAGQTAADPDDATPSGKNELTVPQGSRKRTDEPKAITYSREGGVMAGSTRLSNIESALKKGGPVVEANGSNLQTLTLPIPLQDDVIGVIGFNRSENQPWTPKEIATVESITEQLGLALENQRLFEQTQQALDETERLYQATAELNTAQSYPEILSVLKKYSQIAGQADSLRIIIQSQAAVEEGGEMDNFITLAQLPEIPEPVRRIQANTLPPTLSFQNQGRTKPEEIVVIDDIMNHPLMPDPVKHTLLTQLNAAAIATIPMIVAGQWIGVIDCAYGGKVSFSDEEIRRTQAISSQASVAIQNLYSLEIAEQAVEEMREVDRLKSEFLANMSHELRTPLNSIIGFSRVILKGIDGPINELQQQDLEAIHHSGQHLLDMINNILDLSKIEAGKMELRIEEIQLTDVIDSVVSTARGLVKEKPIRLLTEISENLPLVSADRTRIRQIMLNLLQNASKFTDQGSITVKVQELPQSSEIKISVIDTGIGIAPEDQNKLFERFSQVDSSLTRKVGGSGLGLSITKLLVEMQGGRIDLVSEVNKGSEFWFTLPLAAAHKADKQPVDEIDPEMKVIVSIDDDTKIIDLYKRYLRTHGYQVIGISEPENVLQKIREIQPYAITLDLMMPQKDGWQVIQEIKKDPATANIPVIICSILEEKDKAYQLGAVDYLVKPILESELVAAVNNLDLPTETETNQILVIDDDPDVFQLVEVALRDFPRYQLYYANGGFEGLDKLKKILPDAVVLDIMMPDLDGFSILETMQGDPDLRSTPVIILTAADLTIEQREKLEMNKREVLSKDEFKSRQLINFLENALIELEA